jgi:N-acetylglutamate synthase-like GNAT family acetyltransferase
MSAHNLKLRVAVPEEANVLTQIAHDAKRHWGYPEHWMKHWQADLTISSDYLTNNQVFVAESDGRIVGFYALVIRKDKAELDHMWVAPEHMGTGVGKELFIHAMQDAAGRNISEVQISSEPNAEGFYEKMGAYRIGETVSEIDGQPRSLPLMSVKPTTS